MDGDKAGDDGRDDDRLRVDGKEPAGKVGVLRGDAGRQSGPSQDQLLGRFLEAQETEYAGALAEMEAGEKINHWIWFILPQLRRPGTSKMSMYFGISGVDEAKAYLYHPVLGPRYFRIVAAVHKHICIKGSRPAFVMGSSVDVLKLQSSLELFSAVAVAADAEAEAEVESSQGSVVAVPGIEVQAFREQAQALLAALNSYKERQQAGRGCRCWGPRCTCRAAPVGNTSSSSSSSSKGISSRSRGVGVSVVGGDSDSGNDD